MSIKVLHITSSDEGGAGLCCLRIHRSLLKIGVESKIVTFTNTAHDEGEYEFRQHGLFIFVYKLFSKILRIFGFEITLYNKIINLSNKYKSCFTSPLSPIDLTKCPLVQWADVIHLHWVNNYLDYPSFFSKITKPIIWTLHDENFFYGLAHYSNSRIFYDKDEIMYCKIKHNSIKSCKNLSVVFLSNYFFYKFGKHELVKDRIVKVIHNSVDTEQYKPVNKKMSRIKLHLADDLILVGFISYSLLDHRKGLLELCQAIKSINNKKIRVIAIGNYSCSDILPESVISVGFQNSPQKISEILSACDFFALTSFQEAFAQSSLEALSCGLPVVAFPSSGCSDLINSKNGVVCKDFTVDALKDGIIKIMNTSYNRDAIRQDVAIRFSPIKIAKQYRLLYEKVI